jgi:hypothetical protein
MGGHHGVVRRAGWIVAASVLLALSGVAMAVVAGATTKACPTTVTISGSVSLALSPSAATAEVDNCVAFHNATTTTVTVTVTRGGVTLYQPRKLAKGATTSTSVSFLPTSKGTDTDKATALPSVLGKSLGSASGTISVSPAAGAKPTPTHGSPTPGGGHSSTPAVHPDVAPSPKHGKHPKHSNPQPTGIALPPLPPLPSTGVTALPLGSNPVVAPGPTSGSTTSTATSSPAAAVIAGPIEPADDDRRGLPEAVGVVLALGLATGWGRVLLAAPDAVDDAPRGNHRL